MDNQITSINARRKFKDRLILTLGLRRKPLRVFCDHCGKFIPSDMPWKCGFCDLENYRAKLYSFLNKCRKCKQPPPAFECPHCHKVLFLDERRDASHVAREINSIPKAQVLDKLTRQRMEREEELQHELLTVRLNTELAALQKEIETAKQGSPYKDLQESRSKRKARFIAAHMIAKQERETNKEKYGDDPELLEMANAELEEWLENEALSGSTDQTNSG